MKSGHEKRDPASRLEKLTADNSKLFCIIKNRDVTLEKTGEGMFARYILTLGLEGEGHKYGRDGIVAILDTRLAVEHVLNHVPPGKMRRRGKAELMNVFCDGSVNADGIRQIVNVLIEEILRLEDRKCLAHYRTS